MKIFALLLVPVLLLNGAAPDARKHERYAIEGDSTLMKIRESLPEGWRMYFQGNRLYISRDTAFSAVKQNKAPKDEPGTPDNPPINAMHRPETIRFEHFSRYLDARYPRMTEYQVKAAVLDNNRTREQIENLPQKYNLERGLPRGKSPVGPLIFPSGEIESAYEKEKDALEARITEPPVYYSRNYSFGSIGGDWLPSGYTLSDEGTVKEIETVDRLLETCLGKY